MLFRSGRRCEVDVAAESGLRDEGGVLRGAVDPRRPLGVRGGVTKGNVSCAERWPLAFVGVRGGVGGKTAAGSLNADSGA